MKPAREFYSDIDVEPLRSSPLFNNDLAPVSSLRRNWGMYNIAALWIGMSVCITTYLLGAGLIAKGMNWWEAILTIFLGNLVVLVPMVLNAHAGTRYGIPFPVFARASFGVLGANIPAMLRAFVACGWFGIQTWIGGSAINAMLAILVPGWAHFRSGIWIAFFAFWLVNVFIIIKGIETIRGLESWTAPFMIGIGLVLLFWAWNRAGGFGPMLSQHSKFKTNREFWAAFVPGLTAMVGYWATLSLNIPDFTRFAKSQRDQMVGQAIGLPATMTLYSFIGVAVTSATIVIFGQAIWDPVVLLSKFNQPLVALVALLALGLATLNTNIAANVVSPANDFSNLWPSRITFMRGGLITAVVGVLIQPWRLMANADKYIGWLVGYSGLLGPVAGIMIADYFLIRKKMLVPEDLYLRGAFYEFTRGFHLKAIVALVVGIGVALIGLAVPQLHWLYEYAWFGGFFTSSILYYLMMRLEASQPA
ncbi:MAG: NCS1 family nucleobase:cation symporter-1 [Acidobacteriia bacterium]|nr:NCS1 family nucleobase:cation symporter-1 [Terriglobia bacterium]